MDMEIFPWPVPSDSVKEMLFSHVLEHVGQDTDTFLNIMKEIYRIASDDCIVRVFVPHPRHDFFLIDPTHVRAILPETLEMFDRKKIWNGWQGKVRKLHSESLMMSILSWWGLS